MSQRMSFINRSGACYFLHTSNGEEFLLKSQKLFVSFPNKNNCKDGQQQEFFAQDYLKRYETALT